MANLQQWLKAQNNWNLLATAAAWLGAIVISIVVAPDAAFGDKSDTVSWVSKLAVFLVAVLIGLTFLLTGKLNQKKHSLFWGILATIFLVASIWGVLRYYNHYYSLTCGCGKQRVVKGNVYSDPETMNLFYPQGFDCPDLCRDFKDEQDNAKPELVWTEESITTYRNDLIYSYLVCFPLIAMTIISISQAVYCYQRVGSKKPPGAPSKVKKQKENALRTVSLSEKDKPQQEVRANVKEI